MTADIEIISTLALRSAGARPGAAGARPGAVRAPSGAGMALPEVRWLRKPFKKNFSGISRLAYLHGVSLREQLTAEIPILGLLVIVMAVSLLVTPDLRLRGTGLSLDYSVAGIGSPLSYGCPLYALTGIPCLLCGLTRSFLAMGGLDVRGAFVFHPLGPFLYGLAAASAVATASMVMARKRPVLRLGSESKRRLVAAGAAVLVLAWFVKLIVWHGAGLI